METVTARNEQSAGAAAPVNRKYQAGCFPPLDTETRATLPTDCAAFHLLRQPQTLRVAFVFDHKPAERQDNRSGNPEMGKEHLAALFADELILAENRSLDIFQG